MAAGANTRLKTVVPPSLKPLILVNGIPLVQHALNHASRDWRVDVNDIVTVVSPDNAKHVISVMPTHGTFVVQPEPLGVVDAIERGIQLVCQPWTLILCADNTFEAGDSIMPWTNRELRAAFGSRRLDLKAALRFTRFVPRLVGARLIEASSGETVPDVWIGPLLLQSTVLINALSARPRHETIVQLINACTENGHELAPIPMHCSDMGIPEELL